jgi:hypothetical protein
VLIGEVISALQKRESQESRTVNNQQVMVSCTTTTVNFTVIPKLVNTETGQVAYSRSVASKDSYKVCGGIVDKPIGNMLEDTFCGLIGCKKKRDPTKQSSADIKVESDLDLITKVVKDAAEQIRYDVAPFNFETDVTFYLDARDLPKDARAQFQNAATFGKASRFDRACATWQSLKTPETQKSINLLFNLATCTALEVPDNPALALGMLRQAEALVPRFNKDIDDAIKRLEKATANQSELAKQVEAK